MKSKSKQKMIKVYLDLEKNAELSDELILEIYSSRVQQESQGLIRRFRMITELGMSYDTLSVRLFHEARDLFVLGHFKSTIMVCRSTAEYLAYSLFISFTDIKGDLKKVEKIADELDFRKIVNDHLFKEINPLLKSKNNSKELFNSLYTLGNNWVHPKIIQRDLNVEIQAEKALKMLRELINTEMSVLNDYDISNGALEKKTGSRTYRRGIKLGDKL